MSIDAVLDGLLHFAKDDWIPLWVIADDVEELLGIDDPDKNLEITVVLVRELLQRGFRAGHSPARNSSVHFKAWSNQDPDVVVDFIRQEWAERDDLPSWGDCPWFAAPPELARDCMANGLNTSKPHPARG